MKNITKKQWQDFVVKNCGDSYSLVVCMAILNLWEAGVKTEKEAETELCKEKLGLSGFQAEMAIQFALENNAEKWIDKDMFKIRNKSAN
jgi:hypothetical protein